MICEKCLNKTATIHFQQILNGENTETHLCAECAANEGFAADMELKHSFYNYFQGFLDTFLSEQFIGENAEKKERKEPACPSCGLTYSQFKSIGRLGCAKCYDTFQAELNGIFSNVQAGAVHRGKYPQRLGSEIILEREIDDLKAKLAKAVEEEEYELAATLRDKIKELSQSN